MKRIPTAFAVLQTHHQTIWGLFGRYRRLGHASHPRKRELFAKIKRAIKIQFSIEEELLYPALACGHLLGVDGRLDGVLDVHLMIDHLLFDLTRTETRDRRFDIGMNDLRDRIQEHLQLEQEGPYDEIRRTLKRQALVKLGAVIRARMDLLNGSALAV